MPKLKTKCSAAKRFRLTKRGKIKRSHANASHILTKKSPRRKRHLRKADLVSPADRSKIRKMIPYG